VKSLLTRAERFFPDSLPERSICTDHRETSSRQIVRWGGETYRLIGPPDAMVGPSAVASRTGVGAFQGNGIVCQHLTKNATTDSLCVPMIAQGNTVGVLHLDFCERGETHTNVTQRVCGTRVSASPLARPSNLGFHWPACNCAKPCGVVDSRSADSSAFQPAF